MQQADVVPTSENIWLSCIAHVASTLGQGVGCSFKSHWMARYGKLSRQHTLGNGTAGPSPEYRGRESRHSERNAMMANLKPSVDGQYFNNIAAQLVTRDMHRSSALTKEPNNTTSERNGKRQLPSPDDPNHLCYDCAVSTSQTARN
eukprot:2429813-Amphidinium_carterae.1